ncbi:MAG TPA: hypothetical protein VF752_04110 [Thermoleophilaceae bacterium]
MAGELARLEPLVGEWSIEASIPDAPLGRVVFEWALGGSFLLQRTDVPHPDAPDSLCLIRYDDGSGVYSQHYFDSRGVVRLYAMTFGDGVWTLRRDAPDFSPLNFHQRFIGRFWDDGDTIDGHWETSPDGVDWELDFTLIYRRIRDRTNSA